jgi:hypothetical protein
VTFNKGEARSITGLLDNDSDKDGDVLKITKVQMDPDGRGTPAIDTDNRTVTFTAPAEPGNVVLVYTVEDGRGGSASARVPISITE